MEKNPSPDPPFISPYAKFWGEMGPFHFFWFFDIDQHQLLSGVILPHFDIYNLSVAQKIRNRPISPQILA